MFLSPKKKDRPLLWRGPLFYSRRPGLYFPFYIVDVFHIIAPDITTSFLMYAHEPSRSGTAHSFGRHWWGYFRNTRLRFTFAVKIKRNRNTLSVPYHWGLHDMFMVRHCLGQITLNSVYMCVSIYMWLIYWMCIGEASVKAMIYKACCGRACACQGFMLNKLKTKQNKKRHGRYQGPFRFVASSCLETNMQRNGLHHIRVCLENGMLNRMSPLIYIKKIWIILRLSRFPRVLNTGKRHWYTIGKLI